MLAQLYLANTPEEREQAILASTAALAHIGQYQEAITALNQLDGREDLYERTITLATVRLRLGLTEREFETTRSTIRRIPNGIPQCTRLLAEFAYRRAARPGRGDASWRTCVEKVDRMTREYAAPPGTLPTIDWHEAVLLRGVAQLMLLRPAIVPPEAPHNGIFRWLDAVKLASDYLRSPWLLDRDRQIQLPELSAAPSVLRPEEAQLVRLILAQVSRNVQAARQCWTMRWVKGINCPGFQAMISSRHGNSNWKGDLRKQWRSTAPFSTRRGKTTAFLLLNNC